MANEKKQIDRVKSSVLARSLTMAKWATGAGAQLAGRGLAKMWEDPAVREGRWMEFFARQAQSFAGEVGELKGSLMKAGQMLSIYGEHFFPPEVNRFLKTLQNDSPPVKWDFIEKVLAKELGPQRLAALEIDPRPVASASLGQVHRAVEKSSGRALALKIQYPGVDRAIESDLKALRSFLSLVQVLPKDLDTGPIFAEIRRMLEQETDYGREAFWTETCAARVAGDDRFVVPSVHRGFSNGRILATSFEEGVRPDDPSVQALPQERRDALAASFLDLFFMELFQWRLIQTDAHPGNFHVRARGAGRDQLVLFDFGAVREYPEAFVASYRRMIRAALEEDRPALHAAAGELRFLQRGDDPELVRLFEDFCLTVVEPFRGDVYDWKASDLPQRISRKALAILRGFPLRNPPEEVIFLDRKTAGVFVMMGVLGAKRSGREILLRHLGTCY